jgi:cellobiose phosphorylase
LELQPGEERTIVFLLGAADSEGEIARACDAYLDAQKAQEALQAVADGWDAALSQVRVETPDAALNLLQNGWLLYQVIACRLWARTGFYQSGGAFGFRDQLQDILAVAATNPALARGQILRHAKHQFVEGDVQHWWHEPMGNGVRTRFSDDFLWLPYVTAEYTRISGDDSILLEMVPFLHGNRLSEQEHERYERATTSTEEATLYEHCLRAIRRGLSFGTHGLPLMGGGDWNDGMNAVGEKGLGESIWLGWFLSDVLGKFSSVCDAWGDHTLASTLRETRKTLLKAVEEHAWDGGWYTRAYFDDGTVLGSIHNVDCKIDSIAQSWSVLSGGGEAERTRKAMQSLEDYLVNRDEGLIKLLTPPFDKGKSEPGYIKGYVPGVRENGGQYTHAAAWAIIAFAKLGGGDKALALYDLINPIHHTSSYRGYVKYKTEPYALPADVYAAWPHMGRGGWSWYTGAAGWLYRAGLESILGIQKEGDRLIINPCIPAGWQSYSVEYHFDSATYHITVRNPNRVQTGVVSMTMDEENLTGAVALKDDAREHWIDVLMG